MPTPHIIQRIIWLSTLIGSFCIIQWTSTANAADFGSMLKGLGEAIQQNAQGQRPTDQLGPSLDTQKQQMNREERARNSLKATKTPPSSANWVKIYNDRKITYYYDPSMIRQNDLYVTIPYLVDLPEPGEINLLTDGRYPYRSVITVVQYDCSRRSLPPRSERFWAIEDNFYFPENMAEGEPMMDPARSKGLQWIEGMESGGKTSYFVNKVLNPELKICATYWKRPEGWVAPKTPPYLQKKQADNCEGTDMWKWQNCKASTRKSRLNPHNGTDLVFRSPGSYEGSFIYGSPNGWGIFTFEGGERAGDIYIGFFSSGNFDGFGTYYHNAPNNMKGSIYSGYFKKHLKEGLGRYEYADGRQTEEGIWKEDHLDKTVSLKNFFMDTKKGLPFCQGADATQWTDCFGFFEFDSIQGQALQQRPDSAYAGSFKNGLPDGLGIFFDKRRSVYYQGGIKQGVYEGIGIEFYGSSGESYYSGGFVDGKHHGKGVSQSNGNLMERSEGDYVNGFLIKGTIYKEKQFTYVGSLKNGRFHGEGTYTPEHIPGGGDPVVKKGLWEDGKLLPPGQKLREPGEKRSK